MSVTFGVTFGESAGGGSSDPTLSAESPATGTDLAADRATAKQTPISYTVNNPSNLRFAIWLKFTNDERGYVVYDSVVGFMPPFNAPLSKYVGGVMTVHQLGGWQDDIEWVCINGNGNASLIPVRAGAAGSDPPPHS